MTQPLPAHSAASLPLPPLDGSDFQNDAFEGLHLFEYLEQDDRASYVLDLHAPPEANPIYWNPILRKNKGLRDRILGHRELFNLQDSLRHSADWTFLQWQLSPEADGHGASCRYAQSYWIATTMRKRWRIISVVLAVQNLTADALDCDESMPRVTATSHDETSLSTQARDETPWPKLSRSEKDGSSNGDNHHDTKAEPAGVDQETSAESPQGSGFLAIQDYVSPTRSQVSYFEHEPTEDHFLTRPMEHDPGPAVGDFDWTRPDPNLAISPYIRFFRNFDWASTELGPIETWSPLLRRYVLNLMTDPRPAAMYVGPRRIMVYNEGYSTILGRKHPWTMAKPFNEGWVELGNAFQKIFLRADSGLATQQDDSCFYLERSNSSVLEEKFFRLSMIPLACDNGVIAVYNHVFDTTRQVITEGRMKFLLGVSAELAGSKSPGEFWHSLQQALSLSSSQHEVPFALMYSAQRLLDEDLSTSEKNVTRESWVLEGSVEYSDDALASIPTRFAADPDATHKFIPSFEDLINDPEPNLLRRSDGSLPERLLKNVHSRPFGDRCEAALLIPIRSTGKNVHGFLLLGLNTRRPYNGDYQVFIQLLARQLATAMASAVLREDETRASRIAHSDRVIQTMKTLEAEQRFRRMADLAPVGMFHFDTSGMPIYCNDMWYSITGHPRGAEYPMSWYNVIHPDDHAYMDEKWAELGAGVDVSFEIRLSRPFKAAEIVGGEQVEGSTWILAASYAQRDDDGAVHSILGCLTDISRQKWAEDFQNRRKNEALELKRQQETFIDTTSHEMRNPLSAIVQCADQIANYLGELDMANGYASLSVDTVTSSLDAAQTIGLCAQHQTRIIDDILTLSKLDSSLLHITPVEVQPEFVVENSLRIFDGELRKNDITLNYTVDRSYSDLAVDWVMLDPSRVLQILINLLSNAIKFTSMQEEKIIDVWIGASKERPSSAHGVEYLPRRPNRQDCIETSDWGTGDLLYLQVHVKDTGKGLHEHERRLLFQRFSQTSPRTHVQYGGSGLGLFISRELTELLGGEIGVLSEAGVGSTFAFFVKARRTDPPAQAVTPGSLGQSPSKAQTTLFDIRKQKALNPTALSRLPLRNISPAPAGKKGKAALIIQNVLVVEDNLVNQKVLSKQLKGAGCNVSVANHGGEALEFIAKSRFCVDGGEELDVVLMDVEMPVMDGLTCTKKIREMQKTDTIHGYVPIIAVTANARSEQISTAKDSGMDGVVTKPFRIPDLLPEMERIVKAYGQLPAEPDA